MASSDQQGSDKLVYRPITVLNFIPWGLVVVFNFIEISLQRWHLVITGFTHVYLRLMLSFMAILVGVGPFFMVFNLEWT